MSIKHLVTVTLSIILLLPTSKMAGAEDFDFAQVAARPHPRLILTDADLKQVRKSLASMSNTYMPLIQEKFLANTDKMSLDHNRTLTFVPDGIKNPLTQSREFLLRVMACSYAYRYTRDKSYVRESEEVISYMCDRFDRWMEQSPVQAFIIDAEFAFGLAIAYDWMYKALKPEVKDKMVAQMKARMLEHRWAESIGNNRSQVCNASYLACAAAIAELLDPTEMNLKIAERVENLRESMVKIYSPDGAANETASYWGYGNMYQAFALATLYSAYGTDFGLCDVPGFKETVDYHIFSVGNLGMYFNCGDCGIKADGQPCMWYYAWLFNRPEILYFEINLLNQGSYNKKREIVLALLGASRLGNVKATPPEKTLYSARGEMPVIFARTGWGRQDAYLGIKGGTPLNGHAHMDEGTFIYEAYGVRWATDLPGFAYQRYRNILKDIGVRSNAKDINNACWAFFHTNNQQHNTLTINGHRLIPQGFADWVDTVDTPNLKGGTFDLSSLYALDLDRFKRTAALHGDQSLDITDDIVVRADGDADIRWTLCTQVKPEIREDGILLQAAGVKMLVRTDAPGAVYRTWPNNPAAYDTQTSRYEAGMVQEGYYFCGFTFVLPAGTEQVVRTTFRKQ